MNPGYLHRCVASFFLLLTQQKAGAVNDAKQDASPAHAHALPPKHALDWVTSQLALLWLRCQGWGVAERGYGTTPRSALPMEFSSGAAYNTNTKREVWFYLRNEPPEEGSVWREAGSRQPRLKPGGDAGHGGAAALSSRPQRCETSGFKRHKLYPMTHPRGAVSPARGFLSL
ncbi:hypothetical protein SKAU_G00374560 [Synaphobranchus kaupii]|uniref:Uncharacterized protein n=1 Tax=Synaphobranchus kaupii TaxID=118154 RepID=A0A9Q1IFC2_SYNKA|nr:hypothetical protein SKAU_G00374560 [Synaphobranchus kaupii]